MKIAVAQFKPYAGDIQRNIVQHRRIVDVAIKNGCGLVVFPELSLTSYEPTLADSLAIDVNSDTLSDFQQMSDFGKIVIAVGVPTRSASGISISMILFRPAQGRVCYSKHHLHSDEVPFFVPGDNVQDLLIDGQRISFAICYEISIAEHTEKVLSHGAQFYIASVAKSRGGIDQALARLSAIAKQYGIPVLMSNAIGPCDGWECAGKSSVWNAEGIVLGQLADGLEGILILDSNTLGCETIVM
jgi:predicted amidohydrolase